MRFVRAAVVAFIVAAAVSSVAAQTGGITVKVVDSSGEPLPAATVTISHATGYVAETSSLTNANGLVDFPVLRATGSSGVGYRLSISFPGFAPTMISDIKVRVGETSVQTVKMTEEIVEEVKVTASVPVVDLDETTQSAKFSDEFISDLPVAGRFYQNVLTLAPGVQDADGDGNPNVHGSRDRDFKASVSGVSNVDPLTGQQMSQVNPNSIEEMEVITAGAGVEFSRAQGGFANILQKQGSNEFEGVFEFYWRTSKLDGNGDLPTNNVVEPDAEWLQPSIQISGPIVKDKLWYRLSHEWINRDIPQPTSRGTSILQDDQGIHSDALTWQVSPRNKLGLQFSADPREQSNFGVSSTRPEEASLYRQFESNVYTLTWTAPYSPKILIESRAAWQDYNVVIQPTETGNKNDCVTGPAFLENAQCFNLETGVISGSYNQDWDDHRTRLTVGGDATVFAGRFWGGSHEFKMGLGLENERYTRGLTRRPTVNFYLLTPDDEDATDGDTPERVGIAAGTFTSPEYSQITAKGMTWGLYAQDQYKPAQNFTMTLGLRVDREEINSNGNTPFDPEAESAAYNLAVAQGDATHAAQNSFTKYEAINDFFRQLAATMGVDFRDVQASMATITQESTFWSASRQPENIATQNTNFSPRLSMSWDPWSNGKTKFAATAGRYYNRVDLNIPLIELEAPSTNISFDTQQTPEGGFAVTGVRNSVNPAVNINAVSRDLRTPYNDEWTLQVEREIAQETSLKLTYINRRFRDQFQDYDLNHVPGDFGRCIPQLAPGQPVIVAVGPSDPDYNPAIAPGDGLLDDCIGESEAITQAGGGESGGDSSNTLVLQKPDGTPDLYVQNPGWGDIYLVDNINEIDYEGYTLEMIRRQYRSWEMQASYTYSTAFGNGEDFAQDLGDDRSLVADEQGYQAYDQRHVVKVTSTTITPWGFRLGGTVSWQSGLPYSVLLRAPAVDAIPPAYQNLAPATAQRFRTTYVTGQRNDQRNIPYWNVDVKFSKELNLGRNLNMQVSAEVFNLLNDSTYLIYNPLTDSGEQINGNNNQVYRFGRNWQLGMRLAF
jgi:hypothetical protein